MILRELFLGFLRVGCFAFGGAYSAIPLIREIVLSYGWLTDDVLAGMIAISESTPGSIMVNLATYVGMEQAGVPGAVVATFQDAGEAPALPVHARLYGALHRGNRLGVGRVYDGEKLFSYWKRRTD